MAGIEFTEETRQQAERIGSADILVGIAGPIAPEELRARAERVLTDLGSSFASLRFVFAWPGESGETPMASLQQNGTAPLTLFPFTPASRAGGDFWSDISASQRAVLALGASLNARACIVIGSDLAALDAQAIQLFAYAILERQCGLAMPLYPLGKYEGLVNTGILSPMIRALYGKRARFPLAYDFAASGSMAGRLARSETGHSGDNPLLWPVAVAAAESPQAAIGQAYLNVHHEAATQALDLSTVLAQIVGSLFHDMETYAPQWQRVRGSQPSPAWGSPPAHQGDGAAIDPQPMLDSFLLGSKNLDEVWRLVLPPNPMLELRRLTRADAGQFHMPDDLWATIVYDFALAWRLRTISRGHLLGALTPLYLGWVASYVREVSSLAPAAVEQRLEQFARAWEEKKPYLLSRWRWPDRFIP
jgi:hypothetical protein